MLDLLFLHGWIISGLIARDMFQVSLFSVGRTSSLDIFEKCATNGLVPFGPMYLLAMCIIYPFSY